MAHNPPTMATVPIYGPDSYSRDMGAAVNTRANPLAAAGGGVGITQYTTQTDAYMPPRQNFRGLTGAIRRASVKTLPDSAQLPDASAAVDPVLLAFSANQIARM